jgi:low affinity Fe/Cu permease
LDELIMATKGARNSVAGIEDSSDEELNGAKEALRRRWSTAFRALSNSSLVCMQKVLGAMGMHPRAN